MLKLRAVAGFFVSVALAFSAGAQTGDTMKGAAPGKGLVVQSTKLTATITAIDKAKRDVTLKGPQGNEMTVTAGPQVKNFDALKVGDRVNIEYAQSLMLELKKGAGMAVTKSEEKEAAGAAPGQQPMGVVGRKVTVVADVVAVDAATHVVTLKGPERTVEIRVDDPEQLKRVKKGDQVVATYTQAMALAVEPAK
jgi:Cu/Ag efflux protein CusF